MREILIAQLEAARAQIEATLAVLRASDESETVEGECSHPTESVKEVTTMGSKPEWRCFACGESRNTPFN